MLLLQQWCNIGKGTPHLNFMLISVLLQVDVSRIYPHLLCYYCCVLADTINYKRAFPAVLTQLISLAMQGSSFSARSHVYGITTQSRSKFAEMLAT